MANAPVLRYTGLDRWYVQEQMEILYLPLEWNYCVTARYNILAEDTGRATHTPFGCIAARASGCLADASSPSIIDGGWCCGADTARIQWPSSTAHAKVA